MKILHIGNTAGVGGFIAQAMDRHENTESHVIARSALDPFNCITHGKNYGDGPRKFLLRAIWAIPSYDIIHVHDFDKALPIIKPMFAWKPIFLHYHGSQIRGLWEEKRNLWKWADEVFVSTPDLTAGAPSEITWIPNVVNEDLLDVIRYHSDPEKFYHKTALSDSLGADREAVSWARVHDYKLIFAHRQLEGGTHDEYLQELVNYAAYIDVKRGDPAGPVLEAHSLTGLEALYLGRPVIRWDGEYIEDFPEEHRAQFVARRLMEIYSRWIK